MKKLLSKSKKKLSFSQKFLGKYKFHIRKKSEHFALGMWTRCGIYGLIVFFFGVVVCNLEPESNQSLLVGETVEPHQLAYLFYDGEGNEYNIFGNQGEHGAPQSWEYLFEGVEVTTGNIEDAPTIEIPEVKDPLSTLPAESGAITTLPPAIPAKEEMKEEEVDLPKASTFPYSEKGSLSLLAIETGSTVGQNEADRPGIHIIDDYKRCDTPWSYQLLHGESVLAYKQDLNTPDTCKIQRRVCFDGKLSGSFGQQACAVNTKYSYFQEQFVSYNTPQKPALIQPTPTPGNTAENVSSGKAQSGIDEILNIPNPPETIQKGSKDPLTPPAKEVEQTSRPYPDCIAPRGETVKHGQFVKAYKHKNGFTDAPCEVQLRTCTVGTLEGTYQQLYCRSWETSYIDRLEGIPSFDGGYTSQGLQTYLNRLKGAKTLNGNPSTQELQEHINWLNAYPEPDKLISNRKLQQITATRTNEVVYQREYGNTLQSEALDQILRILDE
ncbi:MAG: hypothetical protein LBD11_00100 [Candidatus Peribacteria bacterium]|jgi:hypothetical protein|nr:hypothetical protein [Candidatus Peribacteria bacterium]